MEKIDLTIVRAIGNRTIDTFVEVYRSKLLLRTMRVLAGAETRHGYHRTTRITFKGDREHIQLAKQFPPCVEDVERRTPPGKNTTARAFLNCQKT